MVAVKHRGDSAGVQMQLSALAKLQPASRLAINYGPVVAGTLFDSN
jgi:hypothetical protein